MYEFWVNIIQFIADGKILYLLCIDTIAVLKEYNIHQHCQTKHSSQHSQLKGKQWSEKLEHLK